MLNLLLIIFVIWCYFIWNCFLKLCVYQFLLLLYRNIVVYGKLILYLSTLLNFLIYINSCFVQSLSFIFLYSNHATYEYSFTSSFPIFLPFIYFSCLITLARTFSTIMNQIGEGRHLCFVFDLGGERIIFWHFANKYDVFDRWRYTHKS